MISYQESQEILKKVASQFSLTEVEEVELENSVGRILASPIYSREMNPPFDNSAMDGFALKLSELSHAEIAGEQWIPVEGLIAAGDVDYELLGDCKAVEIMTGAPLPSSRYSSVIRVEDVDQRVEGKGRKEVRLHKIPNTGENIRRAGEDTKAGEILLVKNEIVQIRHILPLATQGITKLQVIRRLGVGIISTGQEIVDYHIPMLQPGQIRNSTGIYLEKVMESPRIHLKNFGIVSDKPEVYRRILVEAFDCGIDVVVSTGAVSMGVFDFVRPILEKMGAHVHFHKCAIRPGKPILFASLKHEGRTKYVFGVPGNPVSTAVGFNFFVKPFFDSIFGIQPPRIQTMKLLERVDKPEGLQCFFKARVLRNGDEQQVRALKGQASFMVKPLLESDAWVVLPEDGRFIEKGERVEVMPI